MKLENSGSSNLKLFINHSISERCLAHAALFANLDWVRISFLVGKKRPKGTSVLLFSFMKRQNFVLFHYLDNFVGTFLTAKIQFDRLTRVDTNCTARNIVFLPFNWVTVGLHLLSGAISTQT